MTAKKNDDLNQQGSDSDQARAEEATESAPETFFQKLQNQVFEFAESSQEKIPILGILRPLLGDSWLKNMYLNPLDPKRLQAMADAGSFLQEAREIAGLTVQEVAQAAGLSDAKLTDVEEGKASLSLETIFRIASLVARHDPVPFILKFLRTYNPTIESALERWGIAGIPKQFERERRFINIYREHDALRDLSDDEFERLVDYLGSATDLILDVMRTEKSTQKKSTKKKTTKKKKKKT